MVVVATGCGRAWRISSAGAGCASGGCSWCHRCRRQGVLEARGASRSAAGGVVGVVGGVVVGGLSAGFLACFLHCKKPTEIQGNSPSPVSAAFVPCVESNSCPAADCGDQRPNCIRKLAVALASWRPQRGVPARWPAPLAVLAGQRRGAPPYGRAARRHAAQTRPRRLWRTSARALLSGGPEPDESSLGQNSCP